LSDSKKTGADLLVVDNESEWRVERYLRDWTEIADSFDIATGYFEIGGLLALDGSWQKLNGLRILMGDEVSLRTKKAMLDGIAKARKVLDDSLEVEKEKNDFLSGVPAIVEAIRNKKIRCRIYTKDKFHAKAYITHAWHRLAIRCGLKGIRLHDARHTHASLMLKQGIHPKIVQERLGHSSIQITLDTYSHVAPGLQEAAVKRFDELLTRKPENEAVVKFG
jgi:integrase